MGCDRRAHHDVGEGCREQCAKFRVGAGNIP